MVLVLTLNKLSSHGLRFPDSPRNPWATRSGPAADCHLYLPPSTHCSGMSSPRTSHLHHRSEALTKTAGVIFTETIVMLFSYTAPYIHSENTPTGCLRSTCLYASPVLLHPNHLSHPLKSKLLKDCLSPCHIPNSVPETCVGSQYVFVGCLID